MVALLANEARLDLTHVPYAAGPAALVDLVSGRLSVLALPEGLLRPLQAAGKLRVLATSGAARSSFLGPRCRTTRAPSDSVSTGKWRKP